MEEIKLDVEVRKAKGKTAIKGVRGSGFVPAIVYGGKRTPTPIQVDKRSYEKIMRAHHGQSVVFHLNVMEDGKKLRDYSAIVKEEQVSPVSDRLLHIDFNRISLKEKIEVKVSLETKGEPIGVKKDGGSLDHALWELTVLCLPMDIPAKIEIDVSALEIGDAIHVSDLKMPANVQAVNEPEAMVVSVVPPMREEEPSEGEEGAEPELVGGDKEKGEEGEGGDEKKEEAKGKSEGKGEGAKDKKSEEKSE